MIRIQAQPDRIDPAEEKKKTRENVTANVATFALLIALIRSGKVACVFRTYQVRKRITF